MKTTFDYKPLTRDEMWRAKEIALLEEIRNLLKPQVVTGIVEGKSPIEEILPEKKPVKKTTTKKVK